MIINHRDFSRLNIIRQPNDLGTLLNEGRLPQLGNVLPNTVLDPRRSRLARPTLSISKIEHSRAPDFPKAHRLDLTSLGRRDPEQCLAELGIVDVRHAAVYVLSANFVSHGIESHRENTSMVHHDNPTRLDDRLHHRDSPHGVRDSAAGVADYDWICCSMSVTRHSSQVWSERSY